MNRIKNQLFYLIKSSLFFLILTLIVYLFYQLPPFGQDPSYHHFADRRPYLGIPNFLNVASNALFMLAALFGFFRIVSVKERFPSAALKGLALLFAASLLFVGLGSAIYHFNPTLTSLVYDRAAIAVSFSTLFAFLIAERISLRLGLILAPLCIGFGIFSVIYWVQSEVVGYGDLRPYILVQLLPLVSALLIVSLFRNRHFADKHLLCALTGYLIAFLFERADKAVFTFTEGVVSGHTLKHCAAALSSLFLIFYLTKRGRE